MRAAFSGIMAAWIFILAVSGWCCHPPFSCARDSQMAPTSSATGCCKRSCESSAPREEDRSAPLPKDSNPCQPCQRKTECHGVCVYLPGQQASFEANQMASDFTAIAIVPTGRDLHCSVGHGMRASNSHRLKAQQRLHLQYQILLI